MAQNSKTEINSEVHSAATEINAAVRGATTAINTDLRKGAVEGTTPVVGEVPNFTVVNPTVRNLGVDIPAGTVLAGKYVVEEPLSTDSGEANLYICSKGDEKFVAKIYRRQSAVKEDIVVALENIESPYVARLFVTGDWNGSPFEILPYYKYGSLEGKKFSFEQMRKNIIPALNEGIHCLHQHNIIHKDLKPSNIMLCDDQKTVAIIDFGISSVREGGSTVVVTKTGMTPEYSAPETFRGLYLEESDYYSLGITLYELYTGHTPYTGLSKDAIEQYISIQKIPFPEAFPPELKRLVLGLTYNDITNRKDKNNPNRRWTYEEVAKWCKGENLDVPGAADTVEQPVGSQVMPPFRSQYKKYTTVDSLAEALGRDWANGKKRLYRSLLANHFKTFDQEIANYCMDAEEAVQKTPGRADIEFFCLLYKMNPQMQSFHWIDRHFESMNELGNTMMMALGQSDADVLQMIDEFMNNHLFSEREKIVSRSDATRTRNISAVESKYLLSKRNNDTRAMSEQAYILAYLYSGSRKLKTSFGTFDSIDALTAYAKELLTKAPDQIDKLSSELMMRVSKVKLKTDEAYTNVDMDVAVPEFSAWLYVQGKSEVLKY